MNTADFLTRSTMSGLKFAGRGRRTPPKISVLVTICAVVGLVSGALVSVALLSNGVTAPGFASVDLTSAGLAPVVDGVGVGGRVLNTSGGDGFGLTGVSGSRLRTQISAAARPRIVTPPIEPAIISALLFF